MPACAPGWAGASASTRGPRRLLFVLILLIVPGSQILIYPVLWILMPEETPAAAFVPMTAEQEMSSAA